MKTEEILEYMALLDSADDFKPLVKKVAEVIKDYSGEFKELVEDLADYIRKNRVKSVNFYTDEGFSKQEAILMSMHDTTSLEKMMSKFNYRSK